MWPRAGGDSRGPQRPVLPAAEDWEVLGNDVQIVFLLSTKDTRKTRDAARRVPFRKQETGRNGRSSGSVRGACAVAKASPRETPSKPPFPS